MRAFKVPEPVDPRRHRGYQCRMPGWFRTIAALHLLALTLAVGAVAARADVAQAGGTSVRPSEFMIYQYPGVSLVVRVDVREAEFESRITGPDNALIRLSGVAARRIGPVYQWVDAVDSPRQLMIEVTPSRPVERSRISLGLIQFQAGDRNSAKLAHAYRLYSQGTERVFTNDATTWALKAYTLRNAAATFADLGMEEMRLWSEYFAAHLVMHQIHDKLQAMEMSRDIQRAASRAGFQEIELAALVLEGDALTSVAESVPEEQADDYWRDVHSVLERAAALAAESGMESERGRALFNDGQAYEQQGEPEQAVTRYSEAIKVTDAAGDTDLAGEVRGRAAAVYESLGRTSGAIELLDRMASDLPHDASLERAQSLAEKGRILNETYRFSEAVPVLTQALALQKENPSAQSWGGTGLALGWSLYSLGDMQRAEHVMQEALPRMPRENSGTALFRAYGALANIKRSAGNFDETNRYRKMQGEQAVADSRRAEWLLESARDARAAGNAAGPGVRDLLRQSLDAARRAGDAVTSDLAALQLCLARLEDGEPGGCQGSEAQDAYRRLRSSGLPRASLQGGLTWSRILLRDGRRTEAGQVIDGMLSELAAVQQMVRGVLGAWYWENKEALYRQYMASVLAPAGEQGAPALLAMDRIRLLEAGAEGETSRRPDDAGEELRSLLAAREAATGQEATRLGDRANRMLEDVIRGAAQPGALDRGGLDRMLRGLNRSEAVLAYYFADDGLYAVLAGSGGARLYRLGRPGPILDQIVRLREGMGRSGVASLIPLLDGLGGSMVIPLGKRLPERLYLLPMGPLEGLPFDALRAAGRFLAADHEVIALHSLAALQGRRASVGPKQPQEVFLAGSPKAGEVLFDYDLTTSLEIGRITDRFVGPGLHVVQGAALARDEFLDSRFTGADLVHLAMPGILDLAYPDRSRLALSGTGEDVRGGFLAPADLQGLTFSAGLTVLSETAVAGRSRTDFDGRVPFVSEFLDSGVDAVLFTLWPAADVDTADFMDDFYQRLKSGEGLLESLTQSRRRIIRQGAETNFGSWARFQLYIR